jgi:hypothetical protein
MMEMPSDVTQFNRVGQNPLALRMRTTWGDEVYNRKEGYLCLNQNFADSSESF